ncbi:hypothetical protein M0805_006860 [Coniferiporia weirii]|nr:hypothetical protein M0805_006860 [Coniferiporia weirii]
MFIGRIFLGTDDRKKRKRNDPEDEVNNMASLFPTTTFKSLLQPPPAPSRKPSQRLQRPHNDLDDFLSSDLELSFASTMSLNSPPPSPPRNVFSPKFPVFDSQFSPMAMDISPAPVSKASKGSRPRAFTVARTFGRELSNHESPPTNLDCPSSVKGSGKGLQRSPLPAEWLGVFSRPQEVPPPPVFDSSDAMDVDDCILPASLTQPSTDDPTVTLSAAPTITGYSNLFFDAMSPERPSSPMRPRKRRSLSPEGSPRQEVLCQQRHSNESEYLQPAFEESSSPAPPSPSARKLERFASTGGGLFGKSSNQPPPLSIQAGTSSTSNGNMFGSKRPRRPTVSALGRPSVYPQSAFPILDSKMDEESSLGVLPPPRRAFSGTVAPIPASPSSDNDSEGGPEFSSPAAQAFAKRQTMRTVRRRDGTEDFRPLTGAGVLLQRDVNSAAHSPLRKAAVITNSESPSGRWFNASAGLPGFGDNEAHGKILPCEKVPEDGLMRIDTKTLNALLAGKFDNKVASYQVIDCRFDYEYQGGHIKGAVNINTTAEIEEILLGSGARKPTPSCSGDAKKKTILVFHCEFSAKRAPTFAKHLRSRDRAMNNHVYPRIHYPEVYILKGGYSQYYSESAMFSEPRGYVRMDDPQFARDCRQDLDQFRTKTRFGRTRSYAYGETSKSSSNQQSQHSLHQRNTAPTGGNVSSLFSAAGAVRTRRSGTIGEDSTPRLSTLDEDALANMAGSDDSYVLDGVDRSPCPPPTARSNNPGIMGLSMLNARRSNGSSVRGPIQRAQTYTQIR